MMTENKKERAKMAVLTVKCDRAFVVAADKADTFKNQKRDENVFKKIENVTAKLEKNLKIDSKQK